VTAPAPATGPKKGTNNFYKGYSNGYADHKAGEPYDDNGPNLNEWDRQYIEGYDKGGGLTRAAASIHATSM